jgi:hypothetical protein
MSGCGVKTKVRAGELMCTGSRDPRSTLTGDPEWPCKKRSRFGDEVLEYLPARMSKIPPSSEMTAIRPLFSAIKGPRRSGVISWVQSRGTADTSCSSASRRAISAMSGPESGAPAARFLNFSMANSSVFRIDWSRLRSGMNCSRSRASAFLKGDAISLITAVFLFPDGRTVAV